MRTDKAATAAYHREWYKKNRDRRIVQIRATRQQRKEVNRKRLMEYFIGKKCADCPITNSALFEFDHLKDKVKNISELMNGASWETIEKEIAKCEIVCANCHRLRTFKRSPTYRYEE